MDWKICRFFSPAWFIHWYTMLNTVNFCNELWIKRGERQQVWIHLHTDIASTTNVTCTNCVLLICTWRAPWIPWTLSWLTCSSAWYFRVTLSFIGVTGSHLKTTTSFGKLWRKIYRKQTKWVSLHGYSPAPLLGGLVLLGCQTTQSIGSCSGCTKNSQSNEWNKHWQRRWYIKPLVIWGPS